MNNIRRTGMCQRICNICWLSLKQHLIGKITLLSNIKNKEQTIGNFPINWGRKREGWHEILEDYLGRERENFDGTEILTGSVKITGTFCRLFWQRRQKLSRNFLMDQLSVKIFRQKLHQDTHGLTHRQNPWFSVKIFDGSTFRYNSPSKICLEIRTTWHTIIILNFPSKFLTI